MLYGEVVIQYSSISWFNTLFGVESRASSDSKIAVLHSDGEIKDIMRTDTDNGTLLFGPLSSIVDSPDHFTVISTGLVFNYVYPVNGSYTCSHMVLPTQNAPLEASRFNIIYKHDNKNVFVLMRVKSSDRIPRFIFGFDETCLTKLNAEDVIRKILT